MPHAVLKSGERLAHVLKKVDPNVGFRRRVDTARRQLTARI
jgi:hypothetical protein